MGTVRTAHEQLQNEIAERKRAGEALGRSEEHFRSLIENAADIIVVISGDRTIRYGSPSIERTLGYKPEDLIGRDAFEFVHPEDVPCVMNAFADAIQNLGVTQPTEHRLRHKDGSWRIFESIGKSLLDDPTVMGVVVNSHDITERKRAEEERTRLSMAVEQAAESIVITEPDGTIVYVNPAFERVSGYSRAKVIGQNPRILKSGKQDTEFYRAMWSALTRGEVWSGRFINRRKDGGLYEEEAVISPVRDAAGKVINYVAVKRDVTQEVALEAQLRQAQKMEAIGTLAGGIAHDFNNLLTSIIGFAQLALLEPDGSPRWRKYIAKLPEQGQRAANLISQLLTFSRRAVTERQPLQLLPMVKEIVKMLKRTVPENVAIRLNAPGEIAPVNADLTQMQQVLMNLCVNASQAMPDGGELTLSLEDVTLDEAYCRRYAYARPGDYVCLSVQDTGVGMTPEVQEHIFEPFFTTKGEREGTGLGLAMVYGIVKTHEGHINVYSEVGVGSEFKVYLPAMEVGSPLAVAPAEERTVGGTETLLLVEDEDTVLTIGREMLERLGYTVLTASNGEEALQVYRVHRDEIALVLTDMVMPKMGGQELYEALRQTNPTVKVLLASGYGLKQKVDDLRAIGLRGFVQKPFDYNRLGRVVRETLDE